MPNLITIDLNALPGVLTESLRRVLTAHDYIICHKGDDGRDPVNGVRIFAREESDLAVEVGRNGAQAVAAATQLRGTDEQADALAELQNYLVEQDIREQDDGRYEAAKTFAHWTTALRALRGG